MRSHKFFPTLAALSLALVAGPALADGHWIVSLGAGQSVSRLHGSAIEAAAYAHLHPLLGVGLEGGMAYMNFDTVPVVSFYPVEPQGGIGNSRLASLTDGLTRNRGLFVGPAVRFGQQLYAVASAGIYEFTDNDGNWLARRYGGSAGIGLTGKRRFSPRAEVRYRWAPDRKAPPETLPFERLATPNTTQDASAIVFTLGIDLH
jgi:hypothetical protein